MPNINITVADKIARSDGANYICGNSDYVANFKFDSEWDAYETKTARFSYNGGYVDVVFDGDQCPIPIISDTYCFFVGVYAGNLHTTSPVRVPCKKSILCGSGSPVAPADDVYAQLMAKLNSLDGVEVDNATIIKDAEGKLKTSAGGYIEQLPDEIVYADTALEILQESLEEDEGVPLYIAQYEWNGDSPFSLSEGNEYSIIINGETVYKGTARDCSAIMADGCITVGDYLDVAMSGSIVPCIGLLNMPDYNAAVLYIFISAPYSSNTISFELVEHKCEVHTIDERLIPSQVVKVVEDGDGNASDTYAPTAKAVRRYVNDNMSNYILDISFDNNTNHYKGRAPSQYAVLEYVQKHIDDNKITLKSTSGRKFEITVDDSGTLTTTEVT